ncbi:AsmA-like C-terminal region-containing protein [Acidisphaera rubrifaciens]|uniref:Uncharacterized protein n=1 Tax=Acidisphaera rubrifaciens HS-AP3 TaxID=1231350 RepID=A0A0D6P4Q0_9PROT|nr:AsmA-like C-terminal region-containing protein [Acidisphaera rubrifaciens]GAN76627.1 hypothetical protein Asru_0132_10 [Acidisphaera rubrifaciens HS-AP3]
MSEEAGQAPALPPPPAIVSAVPVADPPPRVPVWRHGLRIGWHVGSGMGGHAGRLLHGLGAMLLASVIILSAGFGGMAWRLSRGPLQSPLLARWLEHVADRDERPIRLHVGSASVQWAGFTQGAGSPLVIRLGHVTASDANGRSIMDVPSGMISLSLGELLLGRLRPREVQVDRARLTLQRGPDGTLTLDLGGVTPETSSANPADALFTELARPPQAGRWGGPLLERPRGPPQMRRLNELRRVRIIDARLTLIDKQLGVTWEAPSATIDLTRAAQGGVKGYAAVMLALADQQAKLTVTADLLPGGAQTHLTVRLADVTPAAILRSTGGRLAALAALDAPVTLAAEATLGPHLGLRTGTLAINTGAGLISLPHGDLRLLGGHGVITASGGQFTLRGGMLRVAARETAQPSVITAAGTARREGDGWGAQLALGVDRVAFIDLPVLWPHGAGGPGARSWVTENVTSGVAHDGHFTVALKSGPGLNDIDLVAAGGSLAADDITVHWLRPIPPVEHVRATLEVLDPDRIRLTFVGGHEQALIPADAGRPGGGIALRGSTMEITGVSHPHQVGVIDLDLAGSLGEAVALLSQPRLHLLADHPIGVHDPQGEAAVTIHVRVPLETKVSIDDIALRIGAHLTQVRLPAILTGHDLDHGTAELTADNVGLHAEGQAHLAGIPARFTGALDFRPGPPGEITQRLTASARPTGAQLAAAGLDVKTVMTGPVGLRATYAAQRDGAAELTIDADLTEAAMKATFLEWSKAAGRPAKASLRARLTHDRLAGIDRLSLEGDGLSVHGTASYAPGGASVLRLDHIVIGATDGRGTIRFPGRPGGPIRADIDGSQIDLSARFSHAGATPPANSAPGPAYVVDARFARALMGRGQSVTGVAVHAESDGRTLDRVRLDGATVPNGAFHLDIAPDPGGRRLTVTAANAGQLLRALDVFQTMDGGALSINGRFADRVPAHPLAGAATIRDFRIRNTPFMAKLLQGMTLYGLLDMLNGPGLGFTRLEAPFTLAGDHLALGGSRIYNAALGMTATGSIMLGSDVADLQGTIVPAYFFNSLLGRVPLVGKLFSPERGGGLFAADFTVKGKLADPAVSVNPLSVLTPGYLRRLFGMF